MVDATKKELAKVDVELEEGVCCGRVVLRCKKCAHVWSPRLLEDGQLPSEFWKCPNGCNFG
jgi:hypothetical protein